MSPATATVQPPAQAAAQAPSFAAGQLRVTGVLLQHAELVFSTGPEPHAFLRVRISTGAGFPYLVQQDLGTSPGSHIAAQSKARLLRRGAHVTATCRGLLPRTDHADAVLRCMDVTDLIPHDLPAHSAGNGA